MKRIWLNALLFTFGLALTACQSETPPAESLGQQLKADGQVFALDGSTPLPNLALDSYSIFFRITDSVELTRRFTQPEPNSTSAIQTDLSGLFTLNANRLQLAYSYESDPYLVCQDVCVAWDTQCYTYTEDVCVQQCRTVEYEECGPSCQNVCTTSCGEVCTPSCRDVERCEWYTDKDGNSYQDCWSEQECSNSCRTECTESCREECSTVCRPGSRRECWDECHPEQRERCDDVCVQTVEECWWQTDTIWVYPRFEDVRSTRTEIQITDSSGTQHIVTGQTQHAGQSRQCTVHEETGVETCQNLNEWTQSDRFVTPLAPPVVEGSASREMDRRIRLSKAAPKCRRLTNNQQDQLTEAQMESLRELRRILGVQPEQVRGRR